MSPRKQPPLPQSFEQRDEDRPPLIAGEPDALPSSTLLRGRSMVQIEHNGALYQLRHTRLGKLILTK